MGGQDSPLIWIGDAWRGLSVDGRRNISEARRDVSIEDDNGRWDVDPEVRAPIEDGTTRTRFEDDLERMGLEARRAEETIVEDLDGRLTSWAFEVGVSGEVDTSLRVLVGVVGSRGRGDGGNLDDG